MGLKAQLEEVPVWVEDRLDSEELKALVWVGELMLQLCLVCQLVLEVGRLGLDFQEVELKLEGGMRNPQEGHLLEAQGKEEGGLEVVTTQRGSYQQHCRWEEVL